MKISRYFFLFVFSLTLLPISNVYSQEYPVSVVDFGWMNRSYTEDVFAGEYQQSAVGNLFTPCKMTLSIIDMVRMRKTDKEKTLRFGDYIGLFPIYAGGTKVFLENDTSEEIGFGTGFSLGAFVLYHFKPDIGIGFNVKWDVSLDAVTDYKSFYSYYQPLIYYSLLGHYKHFSLQFSTTISPQPRKDQVGQGIEHSSQAIELKYLLGSKNYLVGSYEMMSGSFGAGRKDKINTLYLGFGFRM